MAGLPVDKKCKILFLPDNIEASVERGTSLLAAAIAAGVHISASCGGMGVCGTCKVKITSGSVESIRSEKIAVDKYNQGVRQACQSRVLTDLTVLIQPESRLEKAIQAIERKKASGVSAAGWKYSPPLKKYYLDLPPATLNDNANDLFRLMWGMKQKYDLQDLAIDFEVIRKLPAVLRENNWKVTVTTSVVPDRPRSEEKAAPRIINIEAGDTRDKLYALAIDVGTTTVCAQLLDLNRGQILADTIVFNKQISYGADVITRIAFSQKPGGLTKLQEMVVSSINEVIETLLAQSQINRKDITHIAVAGNTTMQHLLLGLEPKYIRLAPYTPNADFVPPVKASSLGINVAEHVYVFTFPSISSYVGGDIVSGVIAAGVHQRKKLTLYIDIGTNGELVIGNADWMVTASCSAGPAFEGGGIKHGTVAISGAIQEFSIDPATLEPVIQTIGDARPRGICGSGLINILAELLEARVIGQNGKFNTALSSLRIRQGEDGYEYVLAWASETQIDQDIVITEVDIDNLIRAKAAMYAGCQTLSRSVNVSCSDFDQVILAGNFGSSLNIDKAITIGLLPDLPAEKFTFIGNGSLSGARLVNFSTDILSDSRKVAQMMTNIELSDNIDFNNNYVAALFLPHTDEKAFTSIMEKLRQKQNTASGAEI
jgi:uncharacterized 2Fe-2S/4Fe-4S cluster protein (DUF4445 family)